MTSQTIFFFLRLSFDSSISLPQQLTTYFLRSNHQFTHNPFAGIPFQPPPTNPANFPSRMLVNLDSLPGRNPKYLFSDISLSLQAHLPFSASPECSEHPAFF